MVGLILVVVICHVSCRVDSYYTLFPTLCVRSLRCTAVECLPFVYLLTAKINCQLVACFVCGPVGVWGDPYNARGVPAN